MRQVHKSILDDVHCSAPEIAKEGKAANSFQVPKEFDPLQAHRGDARSRADDEDRSACTCTVREEFPQKAVLRMLAQRKHSHRRRNERNVVDDCADDPKDQHDNVKAADRLVEPFRETVKYPACSSVPTARRIPGRI